MVTTIEKNILDNARTGEDIREMLKIANSNPQYELETRFGDFYNNTFIPETYHNVFYTYLSVILQAVPSEKNIINSQTIDISYGSNGKNYRKTIDITDAKSKSETFITKEREIIINDKKNGLRVSLNKEITLTKSQTKDKIQNVRFKNRTSIVNGVYMYDFTLVHSLKGNEIGNYTEKELIQKILQKSKTYPAIPEIEVEYIGNKFSNYKPNNSYSEYIQAIGTTLEFMAESNFYASIEQKKRVNDELNSIMKEAQIKLSKPVTFTRKINKSIDKKDYYVTPKADGDRVLLFIDRTQNVYLIFPSNDKVIKTGIQINEKVLIHTILDGEFVNNKNSGIKTFLGFDSIFIGKEDVRRKDLKRRLTHLGDVLKYISAFETERTIRFRVKVYREHYKDLNLFYQHDYLEYNIDGVVFVPKNLEYFNNQIYKWKPKEENTIDFYLQLKNEDEYTNTFDLYVTTKKENAEAVLHFKKNGNVFHLVSEQEVQERDYIKQVYIKRFKNLEMKVSKNFVFEYNQPIVSGSVVECKIVLSNGNQGGNQGQYERVEPVRIRWDKYYRAQAGNFETFAEQAWSSSISGVTFEELLGKNDKQQERKTSEMYRLRKFHNWVKESALGDTKALIPYDYNLEVLDLSSGRGGDIHKYNRMGNVSLVVGLDIDEKSVKEAQKRVKEAQLETPIFVFDTLDISKKLVFNHLKSKGMDSNFHLVTNFFALHYFFKSKKTLDIFLRNVSENLVKGGYFIGTCFDGNHVRQLLGNLKKGESISSANYTIVKEYEDDKLKSPYGNEISVDMKGTIYFDKFEKKGGETKGIKEYLVDFNELERVALLDHGLKLIALKPFEKLYEIYNINTIMNRPENSHLSLDYEEKLISYLNVVFVFEKVNYSKIEKTQLNIDLGLEQDTNTSNVNETPPVSTKSKTDTNTSNVNEDPPISKDSVSEKRTNVKEEGKEMKPPKYARKPYCIQDVKDKNVDVKYLKLIELKVLAKEAKIKGYSKMNKEQLCEALSLLVKK